MTCQQYYFKIDFWPVILLLGSIVAKSIDNYYPKKSCEGRDSNPRTSTRLGPKPSAFDRLGNPRSRNTKIAVQYLR